MSDYITPEEWKTILAELDHESDRAVGIVAGALVDTTLKQCITHRLMPLSNTFLDVLFGEKGPLCTFSAKIDLGFALGLYGNKAKTNLHLIRSIRNQFAHYFSRDFAHPKIAKLCEQLSDYSGKAELDKKVMGDALGDQATRIIMRWRYKETAGLLIQGISREGRIVRHPPAPTHLV